MWRCPYFCHWKRSNAHFREIETVVSSQQVLWFVLGLDVFKPEQFLGLDVFKPEQFICSIFEMKIFKTGTANIKFFKFIPNRVLCILRGHINVNIAFQWCHVWKPIFIDDTTIMGIENQCVFNCRMQLVFTILVSNYGCWSNCRGFDLDGIVKYRNSSYFSYFSSYFGILREMSPEATLGYVEYKSF